MAMILVTHDLGVVAGRADDIAVMYAGQIVEQAPDHARCSPTCATRTPRRCCSRSRSSRCRTTPGCRPSAAARRTWSTRRRAASSPPAARTRRTSAARRTRRSTDHGTPGHAFACFYPVELRPRAPRRWLGTRRPTCTAASTTDPDRRWCPDGRHRHAHLRSPDETSCCGSRTWWSSSPPAVKGLKVNAVTDVSIDVRQGETLGLVGESGCGKSTTGKAIMQLPPPTGGTVMFDGKDLTARRRARTCASIRTQLQMIFQDPISSLNPRRRVEDIVAEGLTIWKIGDKASRGQEGRRDAARPSASTPTVGTRPPAPPVLRRPVPAHLDRPGRDHRAEADHLRRAGVGARRVGAGADPQPARGHEGALRPDADLHRPRPRRGEEHQRPRRGDVPRPHLRGRRPRTCSTTSRPTRTPSALLSAIPVPGPRRFARRTASCSSGEIPSPVSPPSGCRFRTRCPRAEEKCASEVPEIRADRRRPVRGLSLPALARPTR